MTEKSTFWNTGAGDDGPYSADEFADFISFIYQHDKTTEAVIKYALNELIPSNTGTTIKVGTGKAIVDGSFFINSSIWSSIVAVPGAGDTNYYLLILQKDWSAQTVRLVLLGPDISGLPVVTQTSGTVWEIALAQIMVTDAGVVTLVDSRVFCAMPMHVVTNAIDDQQITSAKILAGCIDSTKLDTDLFPYVAQGEIACKDLAVGALQVIPQETIGCVLSYRGLGLPPKFLKSLDGCMANYGAGSTPIPSGAYTSVPFDTLSKDQNPWDITYAYGISPAYPRIKIPNGVPDTLYLVFGAILLDWSTNGRRELRLIKNGIVIGGESEIFDAATNDAYLSICTPVMLKGEDVIYLLCFQDSGSPVNVFWQYMGIAAIGA
jgi:hypothetical protein